VLVVFDWLFVVWSDALCSEAGCSGTVISRTVILGIRTETPEDTTPTGALVSNLLRTVQRQTSLIEEQNRRLMDLEQARPLV